MEILYKQFILHPKQDIAQPATSRPVFRQQAVDYASTGLYGTVILARPLSHSVLTTLFACIALALVAFIALFSTTRKAQCQGVLLPTAGVLRILPTQVGVIRTSRVHEGQAVRRGDVLFVIASERSSAVAESAEQVVSALLAQRRDSFDNELHQSQLQVNQRLRAARQRVIDLGEELLHIDEQIALQRRRIALADQSYQRNHALQVTGFMSTAQVQDKQAELLDQRQRLADLQRLRAVNQRDLTSAQADARDQQVQGQRDRASLQRSKDALAQDLEENEARRAILVRAPEDGVITAITAEIGQTVGPAMALASLLPAGAKLEAEIYAPSRAAGFIRPGMTVLLRYQAYPYQKFGQYSARVREVANTSLRPDELALPGAALSTGGAAEPLYRIRLQLSSQNVMAYGNPMPLKSGMLIDASVLLERRHLFEWILEPLLTITGRL